MQRERERERATDTDTDTDIDTDTDTDTPVESELNHDEPVDTPAAGQPLADSILQLARTCADP